MAERIRCHSQSKFLVLKWHWWVRVNANNIIVSDAVIGHPVVWLPKGPRGLGEGTVLCSEFPTGDSIELFFLVFFFSSYQRPGRGIIFCPKRALCALRLLLWYLLGGLFFEGRFSKCTALTRQTKWHSSFNLPHPPPWRNSVIPDLGAASFGSVERGTTKEEKKKRASTPYRSGPIRTLTQRAENIKKENRR